MATGQHTHLDDPPGPGSDRPGSHWHSHSHHDAHHQHEHRPPPAGELGQSSSPPRTLRLEMELLHKNNHHAERNRGWFEGRDILAINLMSAPGAGKTTLLERTIREVGEELNIHVIEGDQETVRDAARIRALGTPVVQINTGAACHLDATMVSAAVRKLNPPSRSTVLIENVGNLICPALFDLGEGMRVVLASVTEGDDKPAKYPHMFRTAGLIVLNKIDLLPHTAFDMNRFGDLVRQLNPKAAILRVSAVRGDGLAEWCDYLRQRLPASTL